MNRKTSFGTIMAIYLLGLIVGGLYVGMVAPVRTVIQAEFSIGSEEGIWIITIYALFYASFIPVIGKLADRRGRKPVFIGCMTVFCVGAFICGASDWIGNASGVGFVVLLAGRILQAIGACGIIPVANAEIGTTAPPDKRGFALGIASAATGLSNVLGAAVGSLIISIVGQSDWAFLFFVCIPFGIIAIVAGALVLPRSEARASGKVDKLGAVTMIAFVFLLLLGIQFLSGDVSKVPPLQIAGTFAASAMALVVFVLAERRAEDPVIPASYVTNSRIVITMAVSFCVGGMINSMTLVPEFAEVALDMPLGSGGVYMALIGVFSLAGPPVGGRLIDKHGAKPVLMAGLAIAAAGYLILAFVTSYLPSVLTMVLGLGVMGMGLGFCMGTPVNYMILENVPESESNMAISTVTLIRQVGLSIAPAVYVAFTSAGQGAAGYSPMFVAAFAFTMVAFLMMVGYRRPS